MSDKELAIAMIFFVGITFVNLVVLSLNIKLYTEFFKERVKGK